MSTRHVYRRMVANGSKGEQSSVAVDAIIAEIEALRSLIDAPEKTTSLYSNIIARAERAERERDEAQELYLKAAADCWDQSVKWADQEALTITAENQHDAARDDATRLRVALEQIVLGLFYSDRKDIRKIAKDALEATRDA